MDYAAMNNLKQAQYAQAGNAIGMQVATAAPMPTVASSVGNIDSLNGRLMGLKQSLAAISDVVGGPRPVGETAQSVPQASGIVFRLNDATETAPRQVTEIEELIGAISRALG